jgi:hypothetical protein
MRKEKRKKIAGLAIRFRKKRSIFFSEKKYKFE